MPLLPSFDVTDAQQARIVAALRAATRDETTAPGALYKAWLKASLIELVKGAEIRQSAKDRTADIELSLGGLQ